MAVITGSRAGIGRATVEEFARHGCDVAVLPRDRDRPELAADEARRHDSVRALPNPIGVADAAVLTLAAVPPFALHGRVAGAWSERPWPLVPPAVGRLAGAALVDDP